MGNNKITIVNDKYEMGDRGELVNVNNIIIDSSLKKMLDIINYNEGYVDYRECVNNLLLIGINEVYGDFGDNKILSVGEKFEVSNNLEIVDGVTIVITEKLKEVMDIEMRNNGDFKTYSHVTQYLMLKGIKYYVDKYDKK